MPALAPMPSAQDVLLEAAAIDTATHEPPLAPAGRKLRVLLLSSDTGGGHRASAAAIRAAIEEALPECAKVNVVDFWVEFARGPFKSFPQQYAFLAKHPWLWKTTYELTRFPPFRAVTETFFDTLAHERVRQAFIDYAPDLVVSVHPLVNALSLRVLKGLAMSTGRPRIPYVTVVTDLGGAHPTWFHPDADMTYVPTRAVADIAAKCRVPADRVSTIGLPVRRDFWAPSSDKRALRAQRNLPDDCPAILLIGGGDGVGRLGTIARALAARLYADSGPRAAQLIVVCGKNTALADSLRAHRWPIPVRALGYVNDMSDWMGAVDIICTKAGPGTIAEALIRGLPILLHSFLPGQEEHNVKYVVDSRVGEYATRPRRIAAIASKWISNPTLLRQMTHRAAAIAAPRATEHIVSHMLRVAAHRRCRNSVIIAQKRRLQAVSNALLSSDDLTAFHYLARTPISHVPTDHSHLWFHLKALMRFTVGAFIMRDAITFAPNSRSFFRPIENTYSDSIENAIRRAPYRSIEYHRRRDA